MLTSVQSFAVENKKALMVLMGLSILLVLMSVPLFVANAQTLPGGGGTFPFKRDVTNLEGGVTSIVTRVANVAGFIILAISVLMILWSAFLFLTSGGDPTKVGSARSTIIFALIGVAVALLAFALPTMVVNLFQGR